MAAFVVIPLVGTGMTSYAAVTRYAVGLVYEPESGFDDERELAILREMLLSRYTVRSAP